MRNQSRLLFIGGIFIVAFLTGCAGVSRVPLDKSAVARVSFVEAKLGIPTDEIIVRSEPSKVSAVTGGGAIPALIDANISRTRQAALGKITDSFYEQIESHDFRSTFGEALKKTLGDQSSLPDLRLLVSSRGISKAEIDERRKALKAGEAFLGVRVWYELSLDARSLVVVANAQLIAPNKADLAYANSFIYASTPITDANPLEAWGRSQGSALAAAYLESAKEIGYMMKMDMAGASNEVLSAENTKRPKAKVQIPFFAPFLLASNGGLVPFSADGFLVEKSDRRQIVRVAGGALYSIALN